MTCKIPTLVRKFAAEFLGTMILVVFGCGAALLFSPTFPLTTLTVALAFGLVIIAMAAAIGDISGCHINPAVSLAMLLDGRMGIGEFLTYLAAQFLGGIAGGGVLALISNGNVQSGLGSNGYLESTSSHISILGAFVIEIILTFVFVFVVLRLYSLGCDNVSVNAHTDRKDNTCDTRDSQRKAVDISKETCDAGNRAYYLTYKCDRRNKARQLIDYDDICSNNDKGDKSCKHHCVLCTLTKCR